jgi:hypothetical protein
MNCTTVIVKAATASTRQAIIFGAALVLVPFYSPADCPSCDEANNKTSLRIIDGTTTPETGVICCENHSKKVLILDRTPCSNDHKVYVRYSGNYSCLQDGKAACNGEPLYVVHQD